MSKIGKINISIPDKVKVALAGNILILRDLLEKSQSKLDLEMFELRYKRRKRNFIKTKKNWSKF